MKEMRKQILIKKRKNWEKGWDYFVGEEKSW